MIERGEAIARVAFDSHVWCGNDEVQHGSRADIPFQALEWDIGAAAMLHFIVATPNVRIERYPRDCLAPFYHEFSLAQNPLVIDGPFTTLNQGAGLGIELDYERLRKAML